MPQRIGKPALRLGEPGRAPLSARHRPGTKSDHLPQPRPLEVLQVVLQDYFSERFQVCLLVGGVHEIA
jgi:hypothetical protein